MNKPKIKPLPSMPFPTHNPAEPCRCAAYKLLSRPIAGPDLVLVVSGLAGVHKRTAARFLRGESVRPASQARMEGVLALLKQIQA